MVAGGMSRRAVAREIGCGRDAVDRVIKNDYSDRKVMTAEERAEADKARYRRHNAKRRQSHAYKLQRKESERRYRLQNQEKRRERYSNWRAANPDYDRNYYKTPQRRIACCMRARIKSALDRVLAGKSTDSQTLLGTTVSEWIATQDPAIVEAMMNGEAVHVDEIRPCSSFDLTDPAQQACCFNWRNRQLLLADDNLSKAAKWDRVEWEAMMIAKGWQGKLF